MNGLWFRAIALPVQRETAGRRRGVAMSKKDRSATAKPNYKDLSDDEEKEPWELAGENWNKRKPQPPPKPSAPSKGSATKRGSGHFSSSEAATTGKKKSPPSQPPTSQKMTSFLHKPVAGKRPAESDDDVEDSDDDSDDEFNFKMEGNPKDAKVKGKAGGKAGAQAKLQKTGGKQKSVCGRRMHAPFISRLLVSTGAPVAPAFPSHLRSRPLVPHAVVRDGRHGWEEQGGHGGR